MTSKYQIVIPMSGFGERFRRAGYNVPKPLIEIEGKPIIAHVIDMFPGETDFIFICNEDHLNEPKYKMKEIINKYCPTGRIVGIESHKLGPVYAVLKIASLLNPIKPVVVNYCDFTCYWDWVHFKEWCEKNKCDGAIPAYKGFHPHSLGTTNYAYLKEEKGRISDIQEKQPYTENRLNEFASSGTYYYSNALLMLKSFQETIDQELDLNGEYYVSLTYKSLLSEGKDIEVYPLQHFMQWGTPEDVQEYNYWSSSFHKMMINQNESISIESVIIPMAGLGERFRREGYKQTKPLIEVSGLPMVIQAARDLPEANNYTFVLRQDMPCVDDLANLLENHFSHVIEKRISSVTKGQACTALIGLDALESKKQDTGVITVGACDNGVIYDKNKLRSLLEDENIDVIVWGVRGYANAIRHPNMYGWISVLDDNRIDYVSVKTPLKNTSEDPIILGTFTFRNGKKMRKCIDNLIERNGKINEEYYLDSCINDAIELGMRCVLFEVDAYLSWGTPNDLKTFNYWQSCFHLWEGHPYSLHKDSRICPDLANSLEFKFKELSSELHD